MEHEKHNLISITEAMEITKSVLENENGNVEECKNNLKNLSQNLQEKYDWEKQQYEEKERNVREYYTEKIKKSGKSTR